MTAERDKVSFRCDCANGCCSITVVFGTTLRIPHSPVYEAKVRAAAGLDHMRTLASGSDLVARTLSSFHVEMHEYPSGSGNLSALPIRIWVLPLDGRQAIEISVGPSGDSIQMHFGNPETADMGEFGRTLVLPQFSDADVCAQSILDWRIEPCDGGQKLILGLSGGSDLTLACHGDDKLRASIS